MTTLLTPISEQNVGPVPGIDEDVEPDAQWKETLRARIEKELQSMADKVRQDRDAQLRGLPEGSVQWDMIMRNYNTSMDRVRRIAQEQFSHELKIARFERSLALGKEIEGEEFEAFRRQQQAIWEAIKKGGAERPQGRRESGVAASPNQENGDSLSAPRASGEHDTRDGPSMPYRDSRPLARGPPATESRTRDRTQSGGSDQIGGGGGGGGSYSARPARSRGNSSVFGVDFDPTSSGSVPYDQGSIGRQGVSSLSRTRPLQDFWMPSPSPKDNSSPMSRAYAHAASNPSPISPNVREGPSDNGRTLSRAGSIRSNERPSPAADFEAGPSSLPRDRFTLGSAEDRSSSRKGKETERTDHQRQPSFTQQTAVHDIYARRPDSRMTMPITPSRPTLASQTSDDQYFPQISPVNSRYRHDPDDGDGIPIRSSRRSNTSDQGSPENMRYGPPSSASARPIPSKRSLTGDFDSWIPTQPASSNRPYFSPQSPSPAPTASTSRPIPRPSTSDEGSRRHSPSGVWHGSQSPPSALPFAGYDIPVPFSSSPYRGYTSSPAGSVSGRRNSNGSRSVRSRSSRQEFWGPADVSQRPLPTFEEQSVASGSDSEEDYGMDLDDLWHIREGQEPRDRQQLTWKLIRDDARRQELAQAKRLEEEARRKEEEARRKEEEVQRKALEIQQKQEELMRREAELMRREAEAKLQEEIRKREEAEARLQEEIRRRQEAEDRRERERQEREEREKREREEREQRAREERERREREEQERREREERERREQDRREKEERERREKERQAREEKERQERRLRDKEERERREREERERREERDRREREQEEWARRQREEETRLAQEKREWEETRRREAEAAAAAATQAALEAERLRAVAEAETQRQWEERRRREVEAQAQRQREAEAQKRREEEEAQKQREEEAQKQQEEEEAQKQREEEEAAQRWQEEEAQRQREAEAQRQREAEAQQQREAEAKRREEARKQQQAETQRRREETRRQREAEAQRKQQEEAQRRQENEARRRREEEAEREAAEKAAAEAEAKRRREAEAAQRQVEDAQAREAEAERSRRQEASSPTPELAELNDPQFILDQQAELERIQAQRDRDAKLRAEAVRKQQEEDEARRQAQFKREQQEIYKRIQAEEQGRLREQEARRRAEEDIRRKQEQNKQREDAILADVLRRSEEEHRQDEERRRKEGDRRRQDSVGSASDPNRPGMYFSSSSASSSAPRPIPNANASVHHNASVPGDRSSTASSSSFSSSASFFSASSGRSNSTGYTSSASRTSTASATPTAMPASPSVGTGSKGGWKSSPSPATPSPTTASSTRSATGAYQTAYGAQTSYAQSSPSTARPQGSYTTTSPLSEQEWARRQEEHARRQFEQFQREQEAQQRRAEQKAMRQLSKEDVIKLFDEHERRWSRINSMDVLTWHSFPWPMLKQPSDPEQVTYIEIQAYVLSPHQASDKTPKERIKDYLRKWHPDRFETRILPRVREDERETVKEGAGSVARHLNKLLSSLSESAENGLFG